MKLLLNIIVEWFVEVSEYLCNIGRPKPKPTLLALNIDWFNNCTWIDQLISFKQIERYITYKF